MGELRCLARRAASALGQRRDALPQPHSLLQPALALFPGQFGQCPPAAPAARTFPHMGTLTCPQATLPTQVRGPQLGKLLSSLVWLNRASPKVTREP